MHRNKDLNKMINAYLTVEAALLFPFVMGVILFVIYLFFFQYNRCLMEQSAAVMGLRGCTLQISDPKELAARITVQYRNEFPPFIAWEMQEEEIQIKGNTVSVICKGNQVFPFKGFDFWGGGAGWNSEVCYKNNRISPVTFIRNYRKMGGK